MTTSLPTPDDAGHQRAPRLVVRELNATDKEQWRELYCAYADFYAEPMTPAKLRRMWKWLTDPSMAVSGLVAEVDGRVVGLAHYRPFLRPLDASTGCYLEDLFVAEGARQSGVARRLLLALHGLAQDRHWSVVRWITSPDNDRARRLYDQVAKSTPWVTYDMNVSRAPKES